MINRSQIRILSATFCLGVFAAVVQVELMREMIVSFYGNELTIGIVLAGWFVGIAVGALAARLFLPRIAAQDARLWIMAGLLLVAALALPAQAYAIRIVRLHVPAGEYASFGAIMLAAIAICLPSSCAIGVCFPTVCDLAASEPDRRQSPVSLVYTIESLGGMSGGVILTYLLLPSLSPFQIVLLASGVALAGAAILSPCQIVRVVLAVAAAAWITLALLNPAVLNSVEQRAVLARWRALGVLPDAAARPAERLVAARDTAYQSIAVTESAGQYVLYADGKLVSRFPDPQAYEMDIHFIMAQKPNARKVLLIGGNPVGDIPELLKYPIEKLVYVELDPGIAQLFRQVMPAEFAAAFADPRVTRVERDAVRFVRTCRDRFDLILVNAPEPTTVGANRFFTLEFYTDCRRILFEYGFLFTAVTPSDRLQSDVVNIGASVYQTLKQVFPVVLVTAEPKNRFFAARYAEDLTFDRTLLSARMESAALNNRHFRPQYFLTADEIDPEKTKLVEEKFASAIVPLNTNIQPITCVRKLPVRSWFGGSGMDSMLVRFAKSGYMIVLRWICLSCALLLVLGLVLRVADRSGRLLSGVSRFMIGLVIATTGACGIALEIALIFVFQNLYGYVYSKIGVIVAAFMAGLVAGAPSGKRMTGGKRASLWLSMLTMEATMLAFALALPNVVIMISLPGMDDTTTTVCEILVYASVAVVGWIVGAEFTVANKLHNDAGSAIGTSAASTDAWDHAGAAMGALFMGVLLVPALGIGASCMVLAVLKAGSLLVLAAALVTMPKAP